MTWAYRDHTGAITEHNNLPQSWQNVSNLIALEQDTTYLASLGWYAVVDHTLPLSDSYAQYYGAPTYELDAHSNIVIKVCDILTSTTVPSPQTLFLDARTHFLTQLRYERNHKLQESDWTQMADIQERMTPEWKSSWADYRQQLRDLPQMYQMPPLDQITEAALIEWPQLPGA